MKQKEITSVKQFFLEMISSDSAVSSKRFSGFIGWLFCIGLTVYCTINNQDTSDAIDMLFICSSSLLGIDSITRI